MPPSGERIEQARQEKSIIMFDGMPQFYEGIKSLREYLQSAERFDGKHVTDDMAIFRYMPKDRFLAMVEDRQIVFAHISTWEDPFEGLLFKTGKDATARNRLYAGFYGQSWTFGKNEMDLRWRAYCPDGDGVRIKTTVGKIRRLVDRLFDFGRSEALVLAGPVVYVNDNWHMVLPDGKSKQFPMMCPDLKKREDAAKWLFLKRRFFREEKEFRVLCHIGHTGFRELPDEGEGFERTGGLLKCKLQQGVASFLEEVILDPRMSAADVDRVKCRLVQADFRMDVSQSAIYQWPNL